jgi:hypothetical protein
MARISVGLPEFDITSCVSSNPEILLMLAEGDDEEDVAESMWLSGQAVKQVQNPDY